MSNRDTRTAAAPAHAARPLLSSSRTAVRMAAQADRAAALADFRAYAASHTFTAEQRGEVTDFTRVDVEWLLSFDPTTAAAHYRTLTTTGSVRIAGESITITAL